MSASDSALPLDIRLMNAAATLLFALVAWLTWLIVRKLPPVPDAS